MSLSTLFTFSYKRLRVFLVLSGLSLLVYPISLTVLALLWPVDWLTFLLPSGSFEKGMFIFTVPRTFLAWTVCVSSMLSFWAACCFAKRFIYVFLVMLLSIALLVLYVRVIGLL